ncbi:MAG: VOC family protein [Proteobacteria bacterium]|nr:VOC family protein [Pseudomonadota bacterium]
MLGRFLEFSLPAPRILESWQFYQRLGYAQAVVGETWAHNYSVVTDGRLTIGLHGEEAITAPLLTYVLPELAKRVGALEDLGIEFDRLQLAEDSFNEALFTSPDGQQVRLLEARTFSPPDHPAPAQLGWFEEYALPVADLAAAQAYWEQLGFVTASEDDDPWPHLSLTSDTLNLGLYLTRELARPTLVFSTDDAGKLRERLADLDVAPEVKVPRALDPDRHLIVAAPEGTRLLVGPPPD